MFIHNLCNPHPLDISDAVKNKIINDVTDLQHRYVIRLFLEGHNHESIAEQTHYSKRNIERIIPAYVTELMCKYAKELIGG